MSFCAVLFIDKDRCIQGLNCRDFCWSKAIFPGVCFLHTNLCSKLRKCQHNQWKSTYADRYIPWQFYGCDNRPHNRYSPSHRCFVPLNIPCRSFFLFVVRCSLLPPSSDACKRNGTFQTNGENVTSFDGCCLTDARLRLLDQNGPECSRTGISHRSSGV